MLRITPLVLVEGLTGRVGCFVVAIVSSLTLIVGACAPQPDEARDAPSGDESAGDQSAGDQSAGVTLFTAYYTIAQRLHEDIVAPSDVQGGGGITRFGRHVVAMTGNGALYRLVPDASGKSIGGIRLPLPPPLDVATFAAEAPPLVNQEWFRAHDLLAREVPDGWQLFVSHHVWNAQEQCVGMAISTAGLDASLKAMTRTWSILTRLQPCLPIGGNVRGVPYAGLEAGGRMQWLRDQVLLLTTGDHQFDGLNHEVAAAQENRYDYGKTLAVDVRTGVVTHFTKGHRNPQGLYIGADGRIWSTEHGPRGGDELNLLVAGGNYGWPYATLGTDYDFPIWPPAEHAPSNSHFTSPRFAWVPSIGVSNLIAIGTNRFPRWQGDLLVSSLIGLSLFRVELEGDRVVAVEPIRIGRPIRDLVEASDGSIWLWTDGGGLIVLSGIDELDRGVAAFAACAACHTMDSDQIAGGLGPNLAGVVGRAVASNGSYPGYSAALREVGGEWTMARLDAFLANPSAFAPGTTMTYRVPASEERQALLAFLRVRP